MMSATRSTFFALLFIAAVALPLQSNAASIERASVEDIQMLLSAASGENSAYWATYIGESRERVYIEYATAVHAGSLWSKKPAYTVYWLPRSELTDEQIKSFIAYKSKFNERH